jgi:hemolysin III
VIADRTASSSPTATGEPRPLLRGVLHLAAAMLAPAGLVLLMFLADSPRRYVGASIFATSLILLYTSSASYHLVPWSDRLRAVMKRVDHSMIFVYIAGTYTPLCLILLDATWGIPTIAAVWSLAAVGVVATVFWPDAPRWLRVGLYLGIGWIGVIPALKVVPAMSAGPLALLCLGGALYTVGAVVYARRSPNPFPRVFGFHEVFHTLVVAGSALHFALIALYVANA